MATTADMRMGLILKLNDGLYQVVDFGQNKTARAAAKIWAKLKSVESGKNIEHTWNSGDAIFPVRVEKHPYQYLYHDDTGYHFMSVETYEQISLDENKVEHSEFYKEGQECFMLINTDTEQPMNVELPDKIELKITYTEPGLRGDTATKALKSATVETGATVMVPLFVNNDEVIRINPHTGEYIERVK
ncbi:MAG: elongation factor P [Chitinophagaceae bacterium]